MQEELINRLMASRVSGHGTGVLPTGDRAAIINALTPLLVSPDQLFPYLKTLVAARKQYALDALPPCLDLPIEEVGQSGLEVLSDDQLATLALDHHGLRMLGEYLHDEFADGTLAASWWEAWRKENARVAAEGRFAHVIDRLRESSLPSRIPTDLGLERRKFRSVHGAGIAFALAASLLLAFFLGTRWKDEGARRPMSLARVQVQGEVTRGIADVKLVVTNGGTRRAFVTVVGLIPGKKVPALFYRLDNDFLDVSAGGQETVENLPQEFVGATEALVVLTDVPAGEAIRLSLRKTSSPERTSELKAKLQSDLEALGIESAIDVIALPSTAERNPP